MGSSAHVYDVVVLGLGGMGSATLAHLARRGRRRVLGLERFGPAHAMGSSHGGSRIIRHAYFLDPAYVPLVLRADELWVALEQRSGERLLTRTGGLMLGDAESQVVRGAAVSAQTCDLPHEMLDAAELRRRFPAMRFRDGEVALHEPGSGWLAPEACVLAHLREAAAAGAEARFGTPVSGWSTTPAGGVRVEIAGGAEAIEAERLVITAGAWFAQVAPEVGVPLWVERNVMHWFAPREAASAAAVAALERLPIYIVAREEGRIYGFPLVAGQGTKLAFYHSGEATTADGVDRRVDPASAEPLRRYLADLIPDAAGALVRSAACLYTMTPDEHFVIGLHPDHPQVALAGGFSGHGFKFTPLVGRLLADLADDGRDTPALFGLNRPTAAVRHAHL